MFFLTTTAYKYPFPAPILLTISKLHFITLTIPKTTLPFLLNHPFGLISNLCVAMKRQRENEKTESLESLELAKYLLLLSEATKINPQNASFSSPHAFECKTCNRKFSSFQALGGHRASHKRQKLEGEEELTLQAESLSLGNTNNNKGSKMHECFICGKKFALGQALGGHMRKHRSAAMNERFSAINQPAVEKMPVLKRSNSKRVVCLDLNLTPLENDLKLLFGKMAPKVQLSVL